MSRKPTRLSTFARTRASIPEFAEKLASVKEASDRTGVPSSTIYYHIWQGNLPYVQLGSRYFVRQRDVDDFVRLEWMPKRKKAS